MVNLLHFCRFFLFYFFFLFVDPRALSHWKTLYVRGFESLKNVHYYLAMQAMYLLCHAMCAKKNPNKKQIEKKMGRQAKAIQIQHILRFIHKKFTNIFGYISKICAILVLLSVCTTLNGSTCRICGRPRAVGGARVPPFGKIGNEHC